MNNGWLKYNKEVEKAVIEIVKNMPTAELSAAETEGECCICLSPFEVDPKTSYEPRRLPCGHVFHTACLINWGKIQVSCPLCREEFGNCGAREKPQTLGNSSRPGEV